ncbi:MAG: GNAT family N-acetyltransferase [Polyangiaceae bacterium]|jgi:GNAT superfamily N-acetyltransferase|nr:GNAT family N-acetyltransferase [Polyangiaceae bacterium]
MLRPPLPAESSSLIALAVSTGLFSPGDARALLGETLDTFHAGHLGEGHSILVWADGPSSEALGWAYFAPDAHAEGIWNLWWIGVAPSHHGRGVGEGLLRAVEERVKGASGRLLVIETSALPALARARRFYERCGYERCGQVPDFYAEGDAKVIFARRMIHGE